jgi:hypothetical protein
MLLVSTQPQFSHELDVLPVHYQFAEHRERQRHDRSHVYDLYRTIAATYTTSIVMVASVAKCMAKRSSAIPMMNPIKKNSKNL